MAADVLVPCITMSSTAMVLYMLYHVYWMYALSSMRKDFNWLYNIIVEIWLKILPIFTKIDLSQEILNGTVCPSLNELIAYQLVFFKRNWMISLCSITRVHSRQGNVREKYNFSRSGNCQGILQSVREILIFGKIDEKRHGISDNVRENDHFRQHDSPVSTYIDQLAKSRLRNFIK